MTKKRGSRHSFCIVMELWSGKVLHINKYVLFPNTCIAAFIPLYWKFVTTVVWVRSQASPCGIFGRQNGTGEGFLSCLLCFFSLVIIPLVLHTHISFTYHWCYIMLELIVIKETNCLFSLLCHAKVLFLINSSTRITSCRGIYCFQSLQFTNHTISYGLSGSIDLLMKCHMLWCRFRKANQLHKFQTPVYVTVTCG
jgi:hypothetical protein